jgi:molybdate-binding protein
VRTAAQRFGLDFIPLVRERYFFALRTESLEEPLMRQLVAVLQLPEYHARVDELTGYDAEDTGKILSLEQAFGAN